MKTTVAASALASLSLLLTLTSCGKATPPMPEGSASPKARYEIPNEVLRAEATGSRAAGGSSAGTSTSTSFSPAGPKGTSALGAGSNLASSSPSLGASKSSLGSSSLDSKGAAKLSGPAMTSPQTASSSSSSGASVVDYATGSVALSAKKRAEERLKSIEAKRNAQIEKAANGN